VLDINAIATVRLATTLIPAGASGRGLMIAPSMAGIFTVHFQSPYSDTKAFLVPFRLGLWHEFATRSGSVTTTPAAS
jgi:short-subunit dehydrogenase